MKLIFIYGPPASGKLTIAEKLSKRTSMPLFHNHLTRDLVEDVYKESFHDHYELIDDLRATVLDYCSRVGTDLIFTYVYDGPEDDEDVKRFIEIVEKNKGEVLFVQLTVDRDELVVRVSNESRKRYRKLTDSAIAFKITEDMTRFTIPFVDALHIDTSQSLPEESVEKIIDTLKLR